MKKILPKKTNLKDEFTMDDLFLPLGFKQHLVKSILNPVIEDGAPKDYSGIIFGPPGTGKTSIIKAIAKEIDWDLIEFGPHDFAKQSGSVEQSITQCFDEIRKYVVKVAKLNRQKQAKTIFVFDEIDALVVSREAGTDRATSFVTTMMLPLFQELRDLAKEHGFIFFVLTNHIERFDPAIKRKGRFDLILPLGPPDHQARFRWFEKCFDDLSKYYKKMYNLVFLTEHSYEITYPVTFNGDVIQQVEPVYRQYTNFDVLARASYRLSLADIKTICDRVLDRRIAMETSLRKNIKKDKNGENKIRIYTSNFIDWINKYRNSDPSTQNEIEKFYRDSNVYARGSYPYAHANSLQEKMEHEFSSLIINHNIKSLENWEIKQKKTIEFSLRNLSEFSVFSGTINLEIKLNRQKITVCSINQELLPGLISRKYTKDFTPTKKGTMSLIFRINGTFYLRGSESVLEQNSAELTGNVIYKKEIKIK